MQDTEALTVPTAAGNGAPYGVSLFRNKWVHVNNVVDWVGVMTVQGSVDGSTYHTLYTITFSGGVPGSSLLEVPMPLRQLRIGVTTDTSGTEPIATFAGERY